MTGTSENRRASRRSSLYAVVVEIGDRRIAGKVRDHSDSGCRLALEEPLRADDLVVTVRRGDMAMKGEIAWKKGAMVGISFPDVVETGLFSPLQKTLAPESRPVIVIDRGQTFRRPTLRQEKVVGEEAVRGELWSSGRHG